VGETCSKAFFFEKKKQKTFANLALAFPDRLGPGFKRFLVLFFKKELLSFFTNLTHLQPPRSIHRQKNGSKLRAMLSSASAKRDTSTSPRRLPA
jgi:hypothetical protein